VLKEDPNFEIQNDVFRVDLDMGFISLRESKPKLPSKEIKILRERLIKATSLIERPCHQLEEVELAFKIHSYDEQQDDAD
jgi:hypothetical protein